MDGCSDRDWPMKGSGSAVFCCGVQGALSGARQLEVTVNGIGERAGNASMEEVVMSIKCRGREQFGGLATGINTRHIALASRMVCGPYK